MESKQHPPWEKQAPSMYQALVIKSAMEGGGAVVVPDVLFHIRSRKQTNDAVANDNEIKPSHTNGCRS